MVEYPIRCIDGCGRILGKVKFPDGTPYPGDAHYGFVCEAEHAPARRAALEALLQNEAAQAVIIRRAQLRNDIDALKTQDGFTDAYIDHDNNPQTPGILKRFWNRIFGS